LFDAFLSRLQDLDVELFGYFNWFCGRSFLVDHIVNRLEDVQLKGLAILGTFGVLWFRRTQDPKRQREILVLVLLSVVLSLIVARALADLLPIRQRPMFTLGIGYRPPLFQLDSYLENWSSFPSDTAAVVFTLATGVWLLSRWWGLLWACFAVIAMVARIYFGIHYPGDIVAGALIGVGVTLAINNEFMRSRVAAPILAMEVRTPAVFYGCLFPFMYEISTLFGFVRSLRHSILRMFLN
jgi:membrane-associated phospholipid phosphatase